MSTSKLKFRVLVKWDYIQIMKCLSSTNYAIMNFYYIDVLYPFEWMNIVYFVKKKVVQTMPIASDLKFWTKNKET
jgi:hypothetical protein